MDVSQRLEFAQVCTEAMRALEDNKSKMRIFTGGQARIVCGDPNRDSQTHNLSLVEVEEPHASELAVLYE